MFESLQLVQLFLGICVFLSLAVATGFLLERLCGRLNGNNNRLGHFWRLFTGTFMLISLYAIITAKGLTILLPLPLVIFFFIKTKLRQAVPQETKEPVTVYVFALCSLLLNFAFYVNAFSVPDPELLKIISGDFNIYYRIAHKLNYSGIETLNLDPVYPSGKPSPYHYGDIWLYALIQRFMTTNPSLVFIGGFTILSNLYITGIYTYCAKRFRGYIQGKYAFMFVLLLAGLFTGMEVFFPTFIVHAEAYTLSVMNWSKVLVPSCFFIGLVLLLTDNDWWRFALLTSMAGLCFINAAPAMFTAVFLLLALNMFTRKISLKQGVAMLVTYVGITAGFVILVYKIMPSLLHMGDHIAAAEAATGLPLPKSIKTVINIFGGGIFQLATLTPFILIFIIGVFLKTRFKNLARYFTSDFIFIALVLLSGLFCWAILYPVAADTVQFYTNVLSPVSSIFISILLVFIVYVVRRGWLSALLLLSILATIVVNRDHVFFTSLAGKKEWEQMKTYFKDDRGAYSFINLQPQSAFNNFFSKNTIFFMPLNILSYRSAEYYNLSLNAPFIPIDPNSAYINEEKGYVKDAPFSRYYGGEAAGKSMDVAVPAFIREYGIRYITVSSDTILPEYLRASVSDSLKLEKNKLTIYRFR